MSRKISVNIDGVLVEIRLAASEFAKCFLFSQLSQQHCHHNLLHEYKHYREFITNAKKKYVSLSAVYCKVGKNVCLFIYYFRSREQIGSS
jgi:hypothetical protein